MSVLERLRPYQTHAVAWAMEREGPALFMEQGTGKTWVTAGIVERHMQTAAAMSALVVCKLANLRTSWLELLEQIDGLTVCLDWESYKRAKKSHRLLLVNYEQVSRIVTKLRKVKLDLAVYDESQSLKGRGSGQSRAARRLQATHRVLLSGTPIEQSPEDLWGQFRFALPSLFGTVFDDFANRWFYKTGYMGKELKFRKQLMPKLLAKLKPHILRITKEDVLDMAPVKYIRHGVDLLGDQRRLYGEINLHSHARVGEREVTCDREVTKLIRLQQVCGGFVRVDPTMEQRRAALDESERTGDDIKPPKGPVVHVGRAKLRRLKSVVESEKIARDNPVVVFCQYTWEVESIADLLSSMPQIESVGVIQGARGKTGKRRRVETIRAFQRGELTALVCQVRAGGVGLDLQRACVGIAYSATWSWIDFDQEVSRLHRSGQTRAVRFHIIFARNTVDERVYEALLLKRSVTELILNRR